MPISLLPQQSLTMELSRTPLEKLLKNKKESICLKLHDSMEFYKSEGMASYSPFLPETLLVGDEEDEYEEIPIVRKPFIRDDNETNESEEDPIQLGDSEDSSEEGDYELHLNLDFSDSDEIVFDYEAEEVEEETKYPAVIGTPFWFGNEDEEQMRYITAKYCNYLKLPEEKKRLIRQPEPFVGRIKRSKVDNAEIFTTFDEVEIYRRSLLPLGSVMPLIRKVFLLTCWSYEDGLPIQFASLPSECSKKMWRDRIVPTSTASILLCLPVYGSDSEYHFFVADSSSLEVTHSPYLLHTIQQWWSYEKYIPQDLRHPQGCPDEEECKGA